MTDPLSSNPSNDRLTRERDLALDVCRALKNRYYPHGSSSEGTNRIYTMACHAIDVIERGAIEASAKPEAPQSSNPGDKPDRVSYQDGWTGDVEFRAALIDWQEREIERLRGALQMITEETICPALWPRVEWDSWSEDRQSHMTALVIANAALEGRNSPSSENSARPDARLSSNELVEAARAYLKYETEVAEASYREAVGSQWIWNDEVWERSESDQFQLAKALRDAIAAVDRLALETAAGLTDDHLRALWRAAGGAFHGPTVETGAMAEARLLPFLRSLASAAPEKRPSDLRVAVDVNGLRSAVNLALADTPGWREAAAAAVAREELRALRHRAAERELECYDFGESLVEETSGWETVTPEDVWTRALFLRSHDNRVNSTMGYFVVEFIPDRDEVLNTHAHINGVTVGHRAEKISDPSPMP